MFPRRASAASLHLIASAQRRCNAPFVPLAGRLMQRRIARAMMRRASRGEAMQHTVAEAAQAIGKSKATVLRAIARGRISANRDEAGMFHIDPAELHRAFPITPANSPEA